jgi:hypothetical protein
VDVKMNERGFGHGNAQSRSATGRSLRGRLRYLQHG